MAQTTTTSSTSTTTPATFVIGLDVGDRKTHYCVLEGREVIGRGTCATTKKGLERALAGWPGSQLVLEAGSQSPWIMRFLRDRGFQVHVVDPRRVALLSQDPRKTDRRDAEALARLESGVPELLGYIHHRGEQEQTDLSLIRARRQLVQARTALVQCCRGIAKGQGVRLRSSSPEAFPKRVRETLESVPFSLQVMGKQIASLTVAIRECERQIEKLAKERYPATDLLFSINGVGRLTALAFVLTIDDPRRFRKSRQVGSWLGLCPRSHASGDSNPALGISKCGDEYLRQLLVQCSHYILGPFGKESDLRRFGLRLIARGGRSAKKRAYIAVARKLAVLLHRLWSQGLEYDPDHDAKRQGTAA